MKIDLVYEYFKKIPIQSNDFSLYKLIYDHLSEVNKLLRLEEFDYKTSEQFSRFLVFCIRDKKIHMINKKPITMQNVISNFISSIGENNILDEGMMYGNPFGIMGLGESMSSATQIKESFLKNFFFNLLNEFSKYLNLNLDSFATSYWFNRMSMESLYYDEVGVGGTINNVSTLYLSEISSDLIVNNYNLESEIIHRIIKLFTRNVSPMIKTYLKLYDKTKVSPSDIFKRSGKTAK